MSEDAVIKAPKAARKEHSVLLTVFTLLCFAGLLAYRVWYSSLYLGAAENPRYLYLALLEALAGAILLVIVLVFRQDFTISASLPVFILVLGFILIGFFSSFGTGFSRWLNVGAVMLYLPPFLYLLFFPLSAFTATGEPVSTGRALLFFLILCVVPVGLLFLGGELEFVTIYLLVGILFALYSRKNGCLDMPGIIFWPLLLLVLAAIAALYGFRIWEHFDVLRSRGLSDPQGYGVLLVQVDSIWQQIRWFGPSPLLSEIHGSPWYTANAGYELIAVMIHGGAVATAVMLLCSLGLVVCLYRMHDAMRSTFARCLTFLTATVYLVETVWNLLSCFVGISARSDIPFLSSNLSVFAIEVILLGAVLSLYRQRRLPLADMEGDFWFRGAVQIEAVEAPAPEISKPTSSALRNPALKKYLHPDRFYMDTRMSLANAEWGRIVEDARIEGLALPDNLSEELVPLCVLGDTLFLLIPFHSPYTQQGDPAADLAPLLERSSYQVSFLYEGIVSEEDAAEDPDAEEMPETAGYSEAAEEPEAEDIPETEDIPEAAPKSEDDIIPDLNFAVAHDSTDIPDFDFTIFNSEKK